MGRPTKSVSVSSGKIGKAEKDRRQEKETALKGATAVPKAPSYLNSGQKKIFNRIVRELEDARVLCALDDYILAQAAVCIDRLQTIERMINEDPELLALSSFMASKEKYSRDFYRCCNELCLSPQARAKLAGLQVKTEKEDPLREALEL